MLKKCCENCKFWVREPGLFRGKPKNCGECTFKIPAMPEWVFYDLTEYSGTYQRTTDGLSCDVFDPLPERE